MLPILPSLTHIPNKHPIEAKNMKGGHLRPEHNPRSFPINILLDTVIKEFGDCFQDPQHLSIELLQEVCLGYLGKFVRGNTREIGQDAAEVGLVLFCAVLF